MESTFPRFPGHEGYTVSNVESHVFISLCPTFVFQHDHGIVITTITYNKTHKCWQKLYMWANLAYILWVLNLVIYTVVFLTPLNDNSNKPDKQRLRRL